MLQYMHIYICILYMYIRPRAKPELNSRFRAAHLGGTGIWLSRIRTALDFIRRRLYWPIGHPDRPSRSATPIGFVPTSRSAKRKKPIGQTKKADRLNEKSRSAKRNEIRNNEIVLINKLCKKTNCLKSKYFRD